MFFKKKVIHVVLSIVYIPEACIISFDSDTPNFEEWSQMSFLHVPFREYLLSSDLVRHAL